MENSRETIIIVDDDITSLTVARNTLAGKYNLFTAPSGEKLFMLLEKVSPSLILLDVEIPGMNGYEILSALKGNKKTARIPVIFVTSKIDPKDEIAGLSLGAVDYITKPFWQELLIKRIDLHLTLERQRKELQYHNELLEVDVSKKENTIFELQNTILKTVAELVEHRDNVTGGHIERTQHYLNILIGFLLEHSIYKEELSTWDINLLIMSSQLHDVGKISIKDEILMKPGKLSVEEFEEMKNHTLYGVDIIRRIEEKTTESAFLRHAEIMAGTHHEKWNGEGYPYGLKGNEIPLQGRLMSIIDVYDALTHARPYKKAFTHKDSIDIIREESGKHFDPSITAVFLMHEREFEDSEIKKSSYTKITREMFSTIQVVDDIINTHGGTRPGHAKRMRRYLEILINALLQHDNFKEEVASWDKDNFYMSAQLHDVGKIVVADHMLNKVDGLTADEYESIKTHAAFGVSIIQQIKRHVENASLLNHAEVLTGSHHENWDGSGYPRGLKGKEIPLQGRIMALVDVYDALTSDRPHRERKTHKEAVEIIRSNSGKQFDPRLVEVFLEFEKEFELVEAC